MRMKPYCAFKQLEMDLNVISDFSTEGLIGIKLALILNPSVLSRCYLRKEWNCSQVLHR